MVSDVPLYSKLGGVLLYFVGCHYWIKRSQYRRPDRFKLRQSKEQMRKRVGSDAVYEALPFVYVLCGILLLLQQQTVLESISGVSLLSAGMLVWWMRYKARFLGQQPPPKGNQRPPDEQQN